MFLRSDATSFRNFFFYSQGLKVTANREHKVKWPCESTHHVNFSVDGFDPIWITLPFPVLLSGTINPIDLPRKGGVLEVVLEKALYDLWPEDIIHERLRWNVAKLAPWTDFDALDKLIVRGQFHQDYLKIEPSDTKEPEVSDVMTEVRKIIYLVFLNVIKHGHERFQLKVKGSTESPDWFIRAHPPVHTSPTGAPILLLSALDHHLQERLQREGKVDINRSKKSFHRIFGHIAAENKVVISLESKEEAQLLRYILRLNSTKIRPTAWQNENLPQGKSPSPWLATFVRPLFLDAVNDLPSSLTASTAVDLDCCAKCGKTGDSLKLCGKCKTISYCSFECRRADSPKHKPSCS